MAHAAVAAAVEEQQPYCSASTPIASVVVVVVDRSERVVASLPSTSWWEALSKMLLVDLHATLATHIAQAFAFAFLAAAHY